MSKYKLSQSPFSFLRGNGNEVMEKSTCGRSNQSIDNVSVTWRQYMVMVYIQTLLPSPFLPDDAAQLLEKCLKSAGRSSAHIFCGSIVVSEKFIEECVKPFEKLMQEKAEKVISAKYFLHLVQ